MIEKKIHYCWFGRGEKPELALACKKSWQNHLPDYQIIEWNEDNFDISANRYVREAYEAKKFAFVTDYVRLYALYHHGGIYMDTDVEVLRSLDKFLLHAAFTGCETEDLCVTGIMAAEKGHPWIKDLLDDYRDKKFVLDNGSYNLKPNTQIITEITSQKYGWQAKDVYQELREDLHIYPFITFCAKDLMTGKVVASDETYTIHHFAGSWLSEKEKKRSRNHLRLRKLLLTTIGYKNLERIKIVRNKLFRKQ